MTLPALLQDLTLPVIGAPMLVPGHPPLTIAQCTAGIVGAMPALSARPKEELDPWIVQIKQALAEFKAANPNQKVAPFAINQMSHSSNERLAHDMEICVKHQVPIVITSLGASAEVVRAVHSYGGLVFHDAMIPRHAHKAIEQGVDGLILLCAGGGGHAGFINPFAFVPEVRRFWDGFIAVSGAITTGGGVAAVRALGADMAYIGTRFVATPESRAFDEHKKMITECSSADVLYTPNINGVAGSYLRPAIIASGLDPDNLAPMSRKEYKIMGDAYKARSKVWSAGQGCGNIQEILPVKVIVEQLKAEYDQALREMSALAERRLRPARPGRLAGQAA